MEDPDEQRSRILVVEGLDDLHVIAHLRRRRVLALEFDIVEKGGVDALIDSVDVEIAEAGRTAVGFVLDADDRLAERWEAVADKLRMRGIVPADIPDRAGTVIEGADGHPRIGVWLMPDNRVSGALEDFVATMVPDGDPVWPLAEDYIGKVPDSALFTNRSKAEIRAWLATRERPLMGATIREGALDTDGPLCRSFAAWLTRLFG